MVLTGNYIIDNDINEILSEQIDWNYFGGKSILITGANGMLASYLVYTFLALNDNLLKNNPIKVIALVRNIEKAKNKFSVLLKRNDLQIIISDVCAFKSDKDKLDIIIHAASQASPKYYGLDPVGTLKANTLGTINLLEIAKESGCQKFLFFSSGEVYGLVDDIVVSESYAGNVDCTKIRSCYAESKRMGENICVCYYHQYGLETYSVRLAHTYGPGVDLNDGRVFADFARDVINGNNIIINSDGSARRCFMYITDMIKGLFYVLLKGLAGNSYNISSMKETSVKNLAEMLCNLYSAKGIKIIFSNTKDNNYLRSKSHSLVFDNTKLQALGWRETVPIEIGFKRMIDSIPGKQR